MFRYDRISIRSVYYLFLLDGWGGGGRAYNNNCEEYDMRVQDGEEYDHTSTTDSFTYVGVEVG
jgi:hypothetical protein